MTIECDITPDNQHLWAAPDGVHSRQDRGRIMQNAAIQVWPDSDLAMKILVVDDHPLIAKRCAACFTI